MEPKTKLADLTLTHIKELVRSGDQISLANLELEVIECLELVNEALVAVAQSNLNGFR